MRGTAVKRIKIAAIPLFGGFLFLMSLPKGSWAETCDYQKMFGREDKTLFGKNCGTCHTVGGPWKKVGPPLNGLFGRKLLITGQPVNDENVRKIIAEGGPSLMPGFQYTLDPNQINELVRFLKEAVCSGDTSSRKDADTGTKSK